MTAASSRPAGPNYSRHLKLAVGLAVSAAFLYATFRTIPFGRVLETLGRAQPAWIAGAVAAVAVAYLFKIHRWIVMLRVLGSAVRFRDAAVPFLGGVALNNVLPFRAGDVIRVVAFQRFTGIPAAGQIGTLVLERLLDLLVLMSILVAAASLASAVLDDALAAGLKLAGVGLAVAIAVFLLAPHLIRWVVRAASLRLPQFRVAGEALLRLSEAVALLTRPALLVRLIVLSAFAWLAEGTAYWCVGHAIRVAADPAASLLALSVGTLSTIIPSSPGYVGTFHYFTARVVAQFGANAVDAAAFAVLIHAVLWLSTTVTGSALLAMSGLAADGRRTLGPDTPGHS